MFAEIAETHQRSQKQGQRQSHGHKSDAHVEKQSQQNARFQSFTDHFIDVKPQKLHEQDENHDEKREQESAQKRLYNILVQFLQ